jgi:hypothetical protein
MSRMKERLIQRLLDLLFPSACPHEFAWPRKRQTGEHYQVCRLCGAEYLYDWFSMRRLGYPPTSATPGQIKHCPQSVVAGPFD